MTFEVCEGSEDDPIQIKNMELLEDAILPGDLRVAFNVQLFEDLDEPIEVRWFLASESF